MRQATRHRGRRLWPPVVWVVLLAGGAPAALAQQTLQRQETTQHEAPLERGQRLVVRHSYGSVRLRVGERQEVSVRADRRIAGETLEAVQAYLRGLTVVIEPQGDRVEVRVDRPPGDPKLLTQTTVDLDIKLPPGAPVEVIGSFGDLDAQGVASLKATMPFGALTARNIPGDVSLEGKHGKVFVSDVLGNVTITHSLGDVEAVRVGAGLEVRNQFAQVRAQGIGGRAVVESRSGPVALSGVGGGAQVVCQHGQVDVSRVRGDVSVTNRGESVTLSDVQGVALIENANGAVVARQIRGDLTVDNRFGPVEVDTVVGTLNVEHANGSVQARGIGADAVISTSNGPLRLQGVRGRAALTNSHGMIDVRDVNGDCTVTNEFASVTAQNVLGNLDVSNAWGLVQADVCPAPPGKGARRWSLKTIHHNVVLGVLPGVGCSLSVDVTSGKIEQVQLPELQVQRSGNRQTAEAALNGGGGLRVEVRVSMGMAQLVKRAAPPAGAAKK